MTRLAHLGERGLTRNRRRGSGGGRGVARLLRARCDCRLVVVSLGRQREAYQRGVRSGAGGNDDELTARSGAVGHRIGSRSKRGRHPPELFARGLVEGVQVGSPPPMKTRPPLVTAAPAGRESQPVGKSDPLEQRVLANRLAALTEWHLPGDVAPCSDRLPRGTRTAASSAESPRGRCLAAAPVAHPAGFRDRLRAGELLLRDGRIPQ